MQKMLCASGISIEKTVKEAFFFLNTRNLSDVQWVLDLPEHAFFTPIFGAEIKGETVLLSVCLVSWACVIRVFVKCPPRWVPCHLLFYCAVKHC